MRRTGNLSDQIASRDNLRLAYVKALRGKRGKADARSFATDLEANLAQLADDLLSGSVPVGNYRQFTIFDPKERIITAPCFRERVLHHAIMNACEPAFDQFLIADTFACRKEKGRLAAVDRTWHFAGWSAFFLKMDVRKYFESIPHEKLVRRLCRIFKDERLLWLFERIVLAYESSPGRGLPIGALTSQHFANFYLGFLDRFVKETLRFHGYVRYMDDFVLWQDSATDLRTAQTEVTRFLYEALELEPKSNSYINRTEHGMGFLGLRVFPDRLTLSRRSRARFRRKLYAYEQAFCDGWLDECSLQRRVAALTAFTRTPNVRSWRYRRDVIERSPVSGHRP